MSEELNKAMIEHSNVGAKERAEHKDNAVILIGIKHSGVREVAQQFAENAYIVAPEYVPIADVPQAGHGDICLVWELPQKADLREYMYKLQELGYFTKPIVVQDDWTAVEKALKESDGFNQGQAYTVLMKGERKIYKDLRFHRFVTVNAQLYRNRGVHYLNSILSYHYLKLK